MTIGHMWGFPYGDPQMDGGLEPGRGEIQKVFPSSLSKPARPGLHSNVWKLLPYLLHVIIITIAITIFITIVPLITPTAPPSTMNFTAFVACQVSTSAAVSEDFSMSLALLAKISCQDAATASFVPPSPLIMAAGLGIRKAATKRGFCN